jgi:hypothetical protein
MSGRPRYTQKDTNHKDIVDELEALGYTVIDVANLANRALDVFVGGHHHATRAWVWVQVEIKPDRKARFTKNEKLYFAEMGIVDPWKAGDVAIIAATSTEDVLRWFGAIK